MLYVLLFISNHLFVHSFLLTSLATKCACLLIFSKKNFDFDNHLSFIFCFINFCIYFP